MSENKNCKNCNTIINNLNNIYCDDCEELFLNMKIHKYCNNCNEIKHNDKFYKNASYCKTCSNQKVSKYFKKKQDTIINCECGKEIKFFCMNSHKKTKIHEKRLKIKAYVTENVLSTPEN